MRNVIFLFALLNVFSLKSQDSLAIQNPVRPKLVVGIVVDQMRYDYLFRFWDKLSEGGFKRMVNEGFLFKNANYTYIPTYTAPGHATIYTGTTPSNHGIVANEWFDTQFQKLEYCVYDSRVKSVGTSTDEGLCSPKKMVVTTLGDEMKLMNNNHSKVIAVALKDRSSVLPGGHKANGAFWLSEQGKWITSSYYMNQLPGWVEELNNERPASFYLGSKWEPMFPIAEYEESFLDNNPYEGTMKGEDAPVFPHDYTAIAKEKGNGVIKYTPMGNTMTKDFAIQAILKEKLGKDKYTDLLSISFSAIDYIGHFYGPHSVEMQDAIIQLDTELDQLFKFIDKEVGKDQVLYFLTADHGAVNVPQFLSDQKIPSGYFDAEACKRLVNTHFKERFGTDSIIKSMTNLQILLDEDQMNKKNLNRNLVTKRVVDILSGFSGVKRVITLDELIYSRNDQSISQVKNGYYQGRCGEIYIILKPGWIPDQDHGTTHGSGYSYDTHVPLLFMGAGISRGYSNEPVGIEDLAPTVAVLINVSFPNGTTGKPLRFK